MIEEIYRNRQLCKTRHKPLTVQYSMQLCPSCLVMFCRFQHYTVVSVFALHKKCCRVLYNCSSWKANFQTIFGLKCEKNPFSFFHNYFWHSEEYTTILNSPYSVTTGSHHPDFIQQIQNIHAECDQFSADCAQLQHIQHIKYEVQIALLLVTTASVSQTSIK